ncbi:MAG: 16S rRNA (cytidine(1402)-2'-O)-methyltransferase [Deltaproteobacteria bacterium]|jgi:16S rRNA (cytidine1402-2'-O)-methyltransferase|nr:16S rRNA (cytidine(1402)-2'-O)-methyltransferase [Deltaproteobacteria bacterium]
MGNSLPQGIYPGLYVIATPIGNLSDTSERSLTVLRHSALVAAEDTRRTIKLLNYYSISAPLLSYREQNHNSAWPKVKKALEEGSVVSLASDAGTPIVSDPGARLIFEVRRQGLSVYPIPGPSAVTAALSVSGFGGGGFTFGGFLPPKGASRKKYLESLKSLSHPLIFFETPHRLEESLADLLEVLGPRRAFLAREMTKLHEEYLLLPLEELLQEVTARPRKGEMTLVLEGFTKGRAPGPLEPQDKKSLALAALSPYIDEISKDTRPVKDIAREYAEKFHLAKSEVYSLILMWRIGK